MDHHTETMKQKYIIFLHVLDLPKKICYDLYILILYNIYLIIYAPIDTKKYIECAYALESPSISHH